jgi:type III pantothenate kinase
VVASAVGGLLDAVEDGVTGLLVPPHDPAALREAVRGLLADSERRRELGARARERALEQFGLEAAASALVAAYRDGIA